MRGSSVLNGDDGWRGRHLACGEGSDLKVDYIDQLWPFSDVQWRWSCATASEASAFRSCDWQREVMKYLSVFRLAFASGPQEGVA